MDDLYELHSRICREEPRLPTRTEPKHNQRGGDQPNNQGEDNGVFLLLG